MRKRRKSQILERDNYTCHYCKGYGDTIDHIIPLQKGGKTTSSNLVCSCEDCNMLKSNISYDVFINMSKRDLEKLRKQRKSTRRMMHNKHYGG